MCQSQVGLDPHDSSEYSVYRLRSDRSRTATPSKFGIYTRPAPRVHQSGETEYVDGERRSCNRRVKAVLSRATECLIRSNRDNPIKVYYHKQRENGCTAQQAKCRARGKLSNCIYVMLRDGEPCEWSDPAFADRKLAQLERAATAAGASV